MKIVALVKAPGDPAAAAAAFAEASGCTLAEARMRTAPEPPALLARLADDVADAVVAKLRAAKLSALALSRIPADEDRTQVRTIAFEADRALFSPRAGEPLELPYTDVVAILRGSSSTRSRSEHTERTKSVSMGAALITGGLKMTKTTERTVRASSEDTEQSIYVFGRAGQAAVMRETQLEFGFLGSAMQPARTANMAALAQLLKQKAPAAFYDERLLRLGRRPLPFVVGGELHVASGNRMVQQVDTVNGLDLLAELMRLAIEQKLLP